MTTPNSIDPEVQMALWERALADGALPKLMWRKLTNKIGHQNGDFAPAVNYDGLVVFDSPAFFGGGTVHAPDFLRVLIELGIGPCERLCDFCSGAGYIGYSLLARRFCKTLCCVDLNRQAIQSVSLTAKYNRITQLVTPYVSDVLHNVPKAEHWDIVVCNPPQLLPRVPTDTDVAVTFDPDWRLHREFYANVKHFMNTGGFAILMEARYESSADTFAPMVRAGGGRIITDIAAKDFRGCEDDRYFLVTQW